MNGKSRNISPKPVRILLILPILFSLFLSALWSYGKQAHVPSQTFSPGEHPAAGPVQFIAIQTKWRLADYRTAESFRQSVEWQMKAAMSYVDPGLPTLVAFPENIGLPLVLLDEPDGRYFADQDTTTTFTEAMSGYIRSHLPSIAYTRLRYRVSWARAVWLHKQEKIARVYTATFSDLARRYGVYLSAGSAPLQVLPIHDGRLQQFRTDRPEVFNTSYLFGPDGRILQAQRKVHLLDIEGKEGLDLAAASADELSVAETPLGKVAVAICLDAFRDDVLQSLAEQGATILLQPSANPAAWDAWQQQDWRRGSWSAVTEKELFDLAVNPMATGNIFDLQFEGQSSIITQLEAEVLSPLPHPFPAGYRDEAPRSGFRAVFPEHDAGGILAVRLDMPQNGTDGSKNN